MIKSKEQIRSALLEIITYYVVNRQRGHSTAMLNGAKNCDCIVIAHNEHHARRLKQLGARHVISINSLHKLRGHNKPIVFDNAALHMILEDILYRFSVIKEQ
jgi:Trk K+ transport system NAD-binding subunit